jgi:hypothetical protein
MAAAAWMLLLYPLYDVKSLHLYTTWIMLPNWWTWKSQKLKTFSSCNGTKKLIKWRGHLVSCHFMFILLTCLYAWHKVTNMKHAMSLNFCDIRPITSLSMRKLTCNNTTYFLKTIRTNCAPKQCKQSLGKLRCAMTNIFSKIAQYVIKYMRNRIRRLLCIWSKNMIKLIK